MQPILPLRSPGGNVCSTVCAVEDDVSQCASSAVNGYKAWSGMTCYNRAKVLLRSDTLSTDCSTVEIKRSSQCFLHVLASLTMCVCLSINNRLVSILGQHSKCFAELCDLCQASCSPSTLVRLLQYYSSWAQLRDTLITNWTPLGEGLGVCLHRSI